jgi:hypothetical protein
MATVAVCLAENRAFSCVVPGNRSPVLSSAAAVKFLAAARPERLTVDFDMQGDAAVDACDWASFFACFNCKGTRLLRTSNIAADKQWASAATAWSNKSAGAARFMLSIDFGGEEMDLGRLRRMTEDFANGECLPYLTLRFGSLVDEEECAFWDSKLRPTGLFFDCQGSVLATLEAMDLANLRLLRSLAHDRPADRWGGQFDHMFVERVLALLPPRAKWLLELDDEAAMHQVRDLVTQCERLVEVCVIPVSESRK